MAEPSRPPRSDAPPPPPREERSNVRASDAAFTATLTREGSWYVAQCREIDVASQGESEHEALENLKEALELWFEDAPTRPREIIVRAA